MYNRLIISVVFILTVATTNAQEPSKLTQKEVAAKIDSLVQKTMEDNKVPAISLSIIQGGEVTIQKGYGVKNRKTKDRVDELTTYQTASISKTFTGIIANALRLEGKLDLDKPITTYLPKTISKKALKRLQPITTKDLLFHRAGIQRNSKANKRKDGEPMLHPLTEVQLLQDIDKLKPKVKRQKGKYYSNLGYALIAYITEQASGKSYEELVNEYVIQKYGLVNTAVSLTKEIQTSLATPYRKDMPEIETKPWKAGKMAPASGIFSNTSDLSKIMLAQLTAYQNFDTEKDKNPLILTTVKSPTGKTSYYGMGLWEFEFDRGVLYGHSGEMDGYGGQYQFNKVTNTGVVLLTSCANDDWMQVLVAQINYILESNNG